MYGGPSDAREEDGSQRARERSRGGGERKTESNGSFRFLMERRRRSKHDNKNLVFSSRCSASLRALTHVRAQERCLLRDEQEAGKREELARVSPRECQSDEEGLNNDEGWKVKQSLKSAFSNSLRSSVVENGSLSVFSSKPVPDAFLRPREPLLGGLPLAVQEGDIPMQSIEEKPLVF